MPAPLLPARRRTPLLLLSAFSAASAFSATITTAGVVARPGETVAAALILASQGEPVSGVQLDLEADPVLGLRIAPGPALPGSAKLLVLGTPAPGVTRLLIIGMNRLPIPDGELLQFFLSVASQSPPFVARVTVGNAIATSPGGGQIPLEAGPVDVRIQSGPPTAIFPPSAVRNAASLQPGPVSPGEVITLFGSVDTGAPLVRCNGIPAPVLFAGPGQINTVVPFEIEPGSLASLEVVQSSSRISLPVAVTAAAPAFFTWGSAGTGPAAAFNQDSVPNSPSAPALPGSVVTLFGTGFGHLGASPLTAAINATPAEVLYAGYAPGLLPGIVQVNLLIPGSLPPDPYASVSLQVAGQSTPPGVTLSIH